MTPRTAEKSRRRRGSAVHVAASSPQADIGAPGASTSPSVEFLRWALPPSGEEPYSLLLLWRFELSRRFPNVALEVLATDADDVLLARARAARFRGSSLRELPRAWRNAAFMCSDDSFVLREEFRSSIEFRRADLRVALPDATFDLILCRNVVCTYFGEPLQRRTLGAMLALLRPGGAFVIGKGERLPRELPGLTDWNPDSGIYRRALALEAGAPQRNEVSQWS